MTVASVLVMYWRVPLGERKHWRQCYAAERIWENVWPAAVVLGLLCLWAVAVLPRGRSGSKRRRAASILGLTALSFTAYVFTAAAGKFDALEVVAAFMLPASNGSYYAEAERIGPYYGVLQKRSRKLPIFANVGDYLNQYAEYQPEEIFPGDTMRVVTHPPGPSLVCYAIQMPLRRFPALADSLIVLCRSVFRGKYGRHVFVLAPYESGRLFLAGITTTGLAVIAIGCLTAPAVFWASRRLGLWSWGAIVFGLSALFPAFHLYNPGVDQLSPLLAVLFWTVLLIACQRKNVYIAALSGVLFFVCMGFTLAFLAALAIPVAATAIYWLTARDKWLGTTNILRIAVPVAAGFGLLALVAWLVTGYDAFGSWARCYRNNKQFNLDSTRGYWPWLLYNPIMFVLFMGGPSATLWLAGTAASVRRSWRRGQVVGRDWLPLCLAAVILLLLVSGVNRGEVERLWMFLMPACVLAGICGLRVSFSARESLLLLALQAAQVAVFRVCYDAWDFAHYFSKDFLGGIN